MHGSRFLQFLSIPVALGLGTALIIACTDGGPTAPENQVSGVETATPFAAPKKGGGGGGGYKDNDTYGDPTCRDGWTSTTITPGTSPDDNGDGYYCYKAHSGGGPKKK
jgi:hypothetical protein